MKIAVSGKGGVGKTLIAGTLARLFAKDGYNVLAIDNDNAMNLYYTLGIKKEVKDKIVPISEMKSLIERLLSTDVPYFCPHGRPTIVRMSLEELARKFGRPA